MTGSTFARRLRSMRAPAVAATKPLTRPRMSHSLSVRDGDPGNNGKTDTNIQTKLTHVRRKSQRILTSALDRLVDVPGDDAGDMLQPKEVPRQARPEACGTTRVPAAADT